MIPRIPGLSEPATTCIASFLGVCVCGFSQALSEPDKMVDRYQGNKASPGYHP